MCPSREPPPCVPASRRYRTHDGTCNNRKKPRLGAAQLPFHRFLAPEYSDGVEGIRRAITGSPLPSARFVSLVVHGSRHEEAPVTMMLAMWGQLLDHDLTATAQPRSLNGSTPRCCGNNEDALHPSCLPIKVPVDDPWLSPLGVRCLEFLRSAPAQRRDCLLSWREQTNQVTSYIDASPIYSSNPRTSDNARIFTNGMLLFGRGPPSEDVCFRAALANQCIRPGDARSGEQPGLLMLHMVWVNEHNQIATELSDLNPHWSDEKLYQETRRIVGAMFQHITYREFLPIILGKEVCRLFDLELETSGYYKGYDMGVTPTVANEFSAAAFRFGHSLIQGSYMRADRHHRFIANNVTLHEEIAEGDLGGAGSLHRLVRGLVNQRALKRDEFITAELTNHLFQTKRFPFGLDLAAINIQRGRDHGLQPYVNWRIPCGLTPIKGWQDLDRVMGPASAHRLRKAYRSVDDIDLFVGGLAERPVVGGIVGPTFSCIIAQQFSNLRKGDRFWYENPGFESSFTPAQLESIRQVAFSQVLCRALGGGTMQPHVFLPADIIQNERLPCGSKLMAPIDLEAWTERDPFTRPNDPPNTEESENQIDLDLAQSIFSTTSTTKRPKKGSNVINKVDFVPHANTGLQIPSNGQIVLTSPRPAATAVNNKLDLSTVRPTPQKDPFLTASTVIDNKLDLTGTTIPPKRKPTRKTTPKRRPTPATSLIINNVDFALLRDSNRSFTEHDPNRQHFLTKRDLSNINLSKLFTKEDNATLLPKKNLALRRGYYPAPAPPPPSDYDDVNNYDYNTDSDPPVFVNPGYGYDSGYQPGYYSTTEEPPPPPQPPYCTYNCYNQPLTTYNPYMLDTRRPARVTTPKRGLSNKIISADYEYSPNNRQTTKRLQAQRTTTPRTVFHRPGLIVINDNRPNDKPIFLSSSSFTSASSPVLNANSFPQNSKNPSSSTSSQSVFSVDPRPQYSSRPIAQQSVPSPIFSQKKTGHKKPLKELRADLPPLRSLLTSHSRHDYDYEGIIPDPDRRDISNIQDHDGYLRPEQNKYEPIKRTLDIETYRNYSLYNVQDQTTRTYVKPPNASLWTNANLVRYAERYQQPLELDDDLDQFVGPLIDQDKTRGYDQSTRRSNKDQDLRLKIQKPDQTKVVTKGHLTTVVTDKVDYSDLNTNEHSHPVYDVTSNDEDKDNDKDKNTKTSYFVDETKQTIQNSNDTELLKHDIDMEEFLAGQHLLDATLNETRQDKNSGQNKLYESTQQLLTDTDHGIAAPNETRQDKYSVQDKLYETTQQFQAVSTSDTDYGNVDDSLKVADLHKPDTVDIFYFDKQVLAVDNIKKQDPTLDDKTQEPTDITFNSDIKTKDNQQKLPTNNNYNLNISTQRTNLPTTYEQREDNFNDNFKSPVTTINLLQTNINRQMVPADANLLDLMDAQNIHKDEEERPSDAEMYTKHEQTGGYETILAQTDNTPFRPDLQNARFDLPENVYYKGTAYHDDYVTHHDATTSMNRDTKDDNIDILDERDNARVQHTLTKVNYDKTLTNKHSTKDHTTDDGYHTNNKPNVLHSDVIRNALKKTTIQNLNILNSTSTLRYKDKNKLKLTGTKQSVEFTSTETFSKHLTTNVKGLVRDKTETKQDMIQLNTNFSSDSGLSVKEDHDLTEIFSRDKLKLTKLDDLDKEIRYHHTGHPTINNFNKQNGILHRPEQPNAMVDLKDKNNRIDQELTLQLRKHTLLDQTDQTNKKHYNDDKRYSLPNYVLPSDFIDTFARTANRHDVQSLLPIDQTDSTNEQPKLPRFDQLTDEPTKQSDTDDDKLQTSTAATTQQTRPQRRTTNFPRKRRPTNPRRPAHNTRPTHNPTNSDRRQPGIALVPFVLLTSIERPDNWVMVNVAKSKKRNPLPEVPQLKSEIFSLSELPKPISAED